MGQFLQSYILLQWMQSYVLTTYEENISEIKLCLYWNSFLSIFFFQNIVAWGKKKGLLSVDQSSVLSGISSTLLAKEEVRRLWWAVDRNKKETVMPNSLAVSTTLHVIWSISDESPQSSKFLPNHSMHFSIVFLWKDNIETKFSVKFAPGFNKGCGLFIWVTTLFR